MTTDKSIDDITSGIVESLKADHAPCTSKVRHGFIALNIQPNEQHYWSPQLTLSMEEDIDGKTIVRGLYGPKPTVWTLFVFFYSVIGLAILVIATLGFSYYSLGKSTDVLWWIPALVGLFLTLYLVSYFGQKVGHDQMLVLHQFFEKNTGLSTKEEDR